MDGGHKWKEDTNGWRTQMDGGQKWMEDTNGQLLARDTCSRPGVTLLKDDFLACLYPPVKGRACLSNDPPGDTLSQ